MTTLEEARTVVQKLSPDERQSLLELLREPVEIAPGIFRTPGVCGSEACVRGMRLPIWLLEEGRRHDMTENQLLQAHPGLTREDLVHAWTYVAMHRAEIDRLIQENSEV